MQTTTIKKIKNQDRKEIRIENVETSLKKKCGKYPNSTK